jgi:hypothetical protein
MAYEQFKKLDGLKNDRTIKSLIGMSRSHFDKLTAAFALAYDTVQLERLQQGEIKQVPSGGPKGYLDTFDKKLFFLIVLPQKLSRLRRAGLPFRSQRRARPYPCDSAPAGSAAGPAGPRRAARAVARNP